MIVKGKGGAKWVTKVCPDDPIGVAARRTLRPRLKAVLRFLRLSATSWQDDIEYVHQLRVHTRRCLAAVEMYREVLPKRERKRLQRCLRKIRKAAGEARDLDVLLEKYRKTSDSCLSLDSPSAESIKILDKLRKQIRRDIKKRRRKAQRPIDRLHQRLVVSHRFKKNTQRLLKAIPQRQEAGQPTFERWARSRFADAIEQFVSTLPASGASLKEWHRFRIYGKQLRYTMELVSTVYDGDFRTGLYACVSELQEHLGRLTDHANASKYLRSLDDLKGSRLEAEILDALIRREQTQFAVTLVQFQSWWMVEAEAELKPLLERYA